MKQPLGGSVELDEIIAVGLRQLDRLAILIDAVVGDQAIIFFCCGNPDAGAVMTANGITDAEYDAR